ncbi:MAG: CotH kinase family protein [Clostridia bacterium]|nr:CotH kinase family protein [Clostridia bacterium]
MPKKLLALALMLISLAALWLIAGDSAGQPHLSELYAEPAVLEEIISARQAHDFTDIYSPLYTGLRFNGYDLFSDEGNGMLLYSLIDGDPRAYDPQVSLISDTGAQVLVSGQSITDEMIRANGSIDLLIYTDEEYALFELKCTTLPILDIERNAETITARHNTRLRLFDNRKEAVNHLFTTDAVIWVRGNHSTTFPKKGYRLSLFTESVGGSRRKHHVPLLGLRSDEDWILNAMYNDEEKIREVLSTNLWHDSCAGNNQWSVQNGVQYRYVEVFFDREYRGVYALGSPVDAKQMAIGAEEPYYKKLDPYLSETAIDFAASGVVEGYEYLGPDLLHPDWEPLRRYYRTVLDENASAESLYAAADVSNAIDLYLFLNLIQGVDHAHLYGTNTVYNLYMAAKKTADGRYVMLYTPWDMDRTWGKGYDNEPALKPDQNVIIDTSIVTRLLEGGDEAMAEKVRTRYGELRGSAWSDAAMLDRIQSHETDMFFSGAYARDFDRWYPDAEPVRSLDSFASYVLQRLACMDAWVDTLP